MLFSSTNVLVCELCVYLLSDIIHVSNTLLLVIEDTRVLDFISFCLCSSAELYYSFSLPSLCTLLHKTQYRTKEDHSDNIVVVIIIVIVTLPSVFFSYNGDCVGQDAILI